MGGWLGGWVALEEWKLRLTSAKVEVEVETELGNMRSLNSQRLPEIQAGAEPCQAQLS